MEEVLINDEQWSCIVVMLTEASAQYESHIGLFKSFAQKKGYRPAIKVITPKDLERFGYVKNVGKMKKRRRKQKETRSKGNESSTGRTVSGVFKSQAQAIKEYVLSVKTGESAFEVNTTVNGTSISTANKTGTRKKKKKKNVNIKSATSTMTSIKQASKMVHDEPECGPSYYFILLGFYDTCLILELVDISVPIVGIISYGNIQVPGVHNDVNVEFTELPEQADNVALQASHSNKSKRKQVGDFRKIQQFWTELDEFIEKSIFNYKLNDFVEFHCEPPSLNGLKDMEKKKVMYDHISNAVYEIARNLRRYIHYINSGELKYIPQAELEIPDLMLQYEHMANIVPLESTSLEHLVNSMVECVVKNELGRRASSEEVTPASANSVICRPVFINNKDKIKKLLYNTKPDLREAAINLYKWMPYTRLIDYLKVETCSKASIQFQLELLYRCLDMTGINEKQFEILIHQILFANFYTTIVQSHTSNVLKTETEYLDVPLLSKEDITWSVAKQGKNERSNLTDTPITDLGNDDEPRRKRKAQLFKLESFLNCEEIYYLKKNNDDDNEFLNYCLIQELDKCELLQSLHRASNFYCNMYYLPSLGTRSILAFFHNDYNEFGLFGRYKSATCNTPIGFRDYYTCVRGNIKKWLNFQEPIIEFLDIQRGIHNDYDDDTATSRIKTYPHPAKSVGVNTKIKGYPLYNICEHLLQHSDKCTRFYSNEGISVTVKSYKWRNLYNYLTFIINSFGTTITYHYFINDQHSLFEEPCQHFNIVNKHGISITCIQKLNTAPDVSKADTSGISSSKMKKIKNKGHPSIPQLTIVRYDFDITLPNGLKIELRHDKNYIKQYYIEGSTTNDEVKQEKYRLFISNGTILIFKKNTSIDILYPNGTKVLINRIDKKSILIHKKDEEIKRVSKKKVKGKSKETKKKLALTQNTRKNTGEKPKEEFIEIKKEIYECVEQEIFCWGGEHFKISANEPPTKLGGDRIRIANSIDQMVISKSDGEFAFYQGSTLTILYSDGTIITSKVIDDHYIEQESIADHKDAKESFNETFELYLSQDYVKMIPDGTVEMLKLLESAYLNNFLKMKSRISADEYANWNRIILSVFCSAEMEAGNISEEEEGTDEENVEDLFEILRLEFKMQHRLYAEVCYFEKEQHWSINLPDSTNIVFNRNGGISTDNNSILVSNKIVSVLSRNQETKLISVTSINLAPSSQAGTVRCHSIDSLGRNFIVNSGGEVSYALSNKEEKLANFRPRQTRLFNRFYVIKKDLSGYEFIHINDHERSLRKYKDSAKIIKDIEDNSFIFSNEFHLYFNRAQFYEMAVPSPLSNCIFSRNCFCDYIPKYDKWLFYVPFSSDYQSRAIVNKKMKQPLAIILRKVKNISIDYKKCRGHLLDAFTKLDTIKRYLSDLFENNMYSSRPFRDAASFNESYGHIYKYIWTTTNNMKSFPN